MSSRSNPFSGAGRLTTEGVRKLNALVNRSEMFGGNSTSPMTRTPNGTVAQYRRRIAYRDEDALLRMFEVSDIVGMKVTVRCGLSSTWFAGTEYDCPTVHPDANSYDPNDTVDITVSASTWIIGTLNSANTPTTITISATGNTTFPTSATNVKLPIALITVKDGVATLEYQAHDGPWFRVRAATDPDDLSINISLLSELQIDDWDVAIDSGMCLYSDLAFIRPEQNIGDPVPEGIYVTLSHLVQGAMSDPTFWLSVATPPHSFAGGHGDTPGNYASASHKIVRVNYGDGTHGTAVEFVSLATILADDFGGVWKRQGAVDPLNDMVLTKPA